VHLLSKNEVRDFSPPCAAGINSPCGVQVFNFSLSPLDNSEFFMNALLMLHADKPPYANGTTYFVEVTAVPSDIAPTVIPESLKFVEEVELTGGYVEFSILEITKRLVNLGKFVTL
jgi:hypothetical protein